MPSLVCTRTRILFDLNDRLCQSESDSEFKMRFEFDEFDFDSSSANSLHIRPRSTRGKSSWAVSGCLRLPASHHDDSRDHNTRRGECTRHSNPSTPSHPQSCRPCRPNHLNFSWPSLPRFIAECVKLSTANVGNLPLASAPRR